MSKLNYISVCSGIEAASVAWHDLGWKPLSFSEIDPFPCSVLKHRFPDVPNYGDMTRFDEWSYDETVDILVGGTPCQSFSVAGLRGGLTDDRGNLALTYCRILQKFRPKWFVWENVPGVHSSWSGDTPSSLGIKAGPGRQLDLVETSDFASIIGAFSELGYGCAWRVLDAQYFGVPQRRRRVFVVGCLGNWRSAAEVLFEQDCLRGNTSKGSKKKQNVTGSLASRTSAGGGLGTDFDLDGGLQVAKCLNAARPRKALHNETLVASPVTSRPYGDRGAGDELLVTSTGNVAHCLNAGGMGRQDYETETMIACTLPASDGGVSSGYHPVVAFSGRNRGDDGRGYDRPPNVTGEIAGTVDTVKPGNVAGHTIGVRRLTPRECERLQGFPDDWTLVPHRGKPAADGPRYKAIGNSMAVPVMRWIGQRINMAHDQMLCDKTR